MRRRDLQKTRLLFETDADKNLVKVEIHFGPMLMRPSMFLKLGESIEKASIKAGRAPRSNACRVTEKRLDALQNMCKAKGWDVEGLAVQYC